MKIINVLIIILIFSSIIGTVAVSISMQSETQTASETFAKPHTKSIIYNLAEYHYVSLVSVKNNTGGTIPANNYTISAVDGLNKFNLTNKTNAWRGSSATITYNYDVQGKMTGGAGTVLGLIILILIAGIILWTKNYMGMGKGK